MDTTDVEANPEEMKSIAENQEVPKEGAAVETNGALEDRQGNRHLAIRRRRQPMKRTQGYGGSRKMLAVARRQMPHLAVPARRKKRGRKRPTVEETRRNGPECNNGMRDRNLKEQLRLRKERASGRISRKSTELKIEKRIFGSSTGLREACDDIVEESAPSETKAQPSEEKDYGGTPGAWHLIRERLGTSGHMEGSAGVVGE
jgi:hypothetical protein